MSGQARDQLAVIGAGYMGGGIALVMAGSGYKVRLADASEAQARAAVERLHAQAADLEALGYVAPGVAQQVADNLSAAADIEAACDGATYVTEAVSEAADVKHGVLERISRAVADDAIIGSNTSAIPIGSLAQSVTRPERFLGVHWMNPAHLMPGVELIPTADTSEAVLDAAARLIRRAGKHPTVVADSPGFVANRLQFALFREAALMVEEGLASPEAVDEVVRNTFGYRLAFFGPFAVGDMAGLDVYAGAYTTLSAAYGPRFAAPQIVLDAVAEGRLGNKAGHGLLGSVSDEEKRRLEELRNRAFQGLGELRESLLPGPAQRPPGSGH